MATTQTQSSYQRELCYALVRVMIYVIELLAVLTLVAVLIEVPLDAGDFSNDAAEEFVDWFHPNKENTIPSWLSALVLAACGIMLYVIGTVARLAKDPWWAYWYIFAVLFMLLSMDEAIQLHERLGWMLLKGADIRGNSSNHFYAWIAAYGVVGLGLAVGSFRFFLQLPRETQRGSLLAAVIFISAAAGLDYLESLWEDYQGGDGYIMNGMVWIEEIMEVCGSTLFLYVLTVYFVRHVLSADGYLPPQPKGAV